MAHGVAGTPENRVGTALLENVHPRAARNAGRARRGEEALVARDELAAAHEAEVPLEPRYVAETIKGEGGACGAGYPPFDGDPTVVRAFRRPRASHGGTSESARSGEGWCCLEAEHVSEPPCGEYGQEIHDNRLPLQLRKD